MWSVIKYYVACSSFVYLFLLRIKVSQALLPLSFKWGILYTHKNNDLHEKLKRWFLGSTLRSFRSTNPTGAHQVDIMLLVHVILTSKIIKKHHFNFSDDIEKKIMLLLWYPIIVLTMFHKLNKAYVRHTKRTYTLKFDLHFKA